MLESTLTSLYHVAWGQCSILLKNKLKGQQPFKTIETITDVVGLLKEIKSISNKSGRKHEHF